MAKEAPAKSGMCNLFSPAMSARSRFWIDFATTKTVANLSQPLRMLLTIHFNRPDRWSQPWPRKMIPFHHIPRFPVRTDCASARFRHEDEDRRIEEALYKYHIRGGLSRKKKSSHRLISWRISAACLHFLDEAHYADDGRWLT
jgi:hypothetical protein